ncbi:MAG: hypothetical protein WAK62_06025 [Terriglobales bacterium]
MLLAIFIGLVVVLMGWNILRMHGFDSDYIYSGYFSGQRYECVVGGLSSEHGTLCFVGADEQGLYLLPHPKPAFSWWNQRQRRVLKKSFLIPWRDINCRSGRVLLKNCIWFDLAPRKIYLYVPQDIGEKLLMDARLAIPART